MSEHLSALVLDEVAAGLPAPDGAAAHLAGCPACAQRLGALKADGAALLARPEAARRLEAVLASAVAAPQAAPPSVPRNVRFLRLAATAALPLAACLVLVISLTVVKPQPHDRLKGTATVELLDPSRAPVQRAAPGDVLVLAAGGAGLPFAGIFAIDASGAVSPLWPSNTPAQGAIAPGARVRLAELEATPGDVRVVALFTRQPRPMAELKRALEAAVARARLTGQSPLDAQLPADAADAVATARLEVR